MKSNRFVLSVIVVSLQRPLCFSPDAMPSTIGVLVFIFFFNLIVSAQSQKPGRPAQRPQVDEELQQRRATALSLMQSLAIEARSYRDEALRARVQARIADVIWDHDTETAHTLFKRAWEIVEAVDEAAPAINTPGRRSSRRSTTTTTSLRREILQLASRRDKTLGEAFLQKLTRRDPNNTSSGNVLLSAAESAERLILAGQFLASGNVERALESVGPALGSINERTIGFLIQLRDRDASAADHRFALLLAIADTDPGSDANTVSLLTSYTFTPSVFLSVSPTGIPYGNSYEPRNAPILSPGLRKAFFEVAARILLRPVAQIDQSSARRAGTHFMIRRLLPLFGQFAPELVPPLTVQLAAMGPDAARASTTAGDLALSRGMNGGEPASIDDDLREGLDRAQTPDERDRAYAFAALKAADLLDPRAHDLADKIEDTETRKGLKTFVDYSLIRGLIRKEQDEQALLLIRKSDLPHTLRAHFLTLTAALILKNDRVRALELFGDALSEARRIDSSASDRVYSLVGLLYQFSAIDQSRTWELLSETIKVANSVADFTGESGSTSVTLEGKFRIRLGTELASPTYLSEVFRRLAEQGFYQALDSSKSFTGEAARALAMIAVARSVLEEKPGKATPNPP